MLSVPDLLSDINFDWGMVLALALILAGIWINTGYRKTRRDRHIAAIDQALREKLEMMLDLIPGVERIDLSWSSRTGEVVFIFGFNVGDFDYHADIGFVPDAVAAHVTDLVREALFTPDDGSVAEAPPPPSLEPRGRMWWEILGVSRDADVREIRVAHRTLSLRNHPDLGGSDDKMAEINAARDEAMISR